MSIANTLNAIHSNLDHLQQASDKISKGNLITSMLTEEQVDKGATATSINNNSDVKQRTISAKEATTDIADLAENAVDLILTQRDLAANFFTLKVQTSTEKTITNLR